MTDETLVREVLHRATDDLTAPVPALTAAATVGGRRLRRRRRTLAAAGSLCAAALVAVPLVASLGSDSTAGTQVATDPTVTPSPSVSTPSVEPTPHLVDNDGWARMPAAEMAATFESLAPSGLGLTDVMLTNEDRAPGEPETNSPGYLLGHLTTNGAVTGSVNLVLYVTGQSDSRYTCPGNLTHPDSCTEILGDDGEPVGRRSVTTFAGGVVDHEVVLLRKNGGLVYVDATNSTDDKWGRGSAVAGPTVPLTLDQLQAIAEDDAWTSWEPPA